MLQSLTTNLHRIQAKLKPPLFLQVLERVLKEISEFYVKDVICMNMFDDTGIEQLGTDINRVSIHDYGIGAGSASSYMFPF